MYKNSISVVIPTRNRPKLVVRAVNSALQQTLSPMEVTVVVDGADLETESALENIQDARLNIVTLNHSVGGAEARNFGVKISKGKWVAFLDDDDEWQPEKLKSQLDLVTDDAYEGHVLGCRIMAKKDDKIEVWAKRLLQHGEDISDYLFVRRSLFARDAQIQTSTLVAKREFLLRVPFRSLRRHQEWDWLLRASQEQDFVFDMSPDQLSIWNMEENRDRISTQRDVNAYKFSLEWIRGYRNKLSHTAYADFLLTVVSDIARRGGNRTACVLLLYEAFKCGKPSAWAFLAWLNIFFVKKNIAPILKVSDIKEGVSK